MLLLFVPVIIGAVFLVATVLAGFGFLGYKIFRGIIHIFS
jgi:hypothetical protein